MMEDGATRIAFEPWSLGDVMIAAAAIRESSKLSGLACHSMWHPLLQRALAEIPGLELLAVDLPYTTRRRSNPLDLGGATDSRQYRNVRDVFSIRGDLRDFFAARRFFPGARIHMAGWLRFFGRKNPVVNFPFSIGWLPVENRYRSWARLTGVALEDMESTYRRRQAAVPSNRQIVLHVGAQWRSKQFPHVVDLRAALTRQGWTTTVLAGPSDPLPPGLPENEVERVVDEQLVEKLCSAEQVITNDSGPMHVAAFLGCRSTVVVRASSIEEWAPPATRIVRARETPRGYRPHRRYMSDDILTGWPTVDEILTSLHGS